MIKRLFLALGKSFSAFHPVVNAFAVIKRMIYTGYYSGRFRKFGKGTVMDCGQTMIRGEKYIEIGADCHISEGCQITATDSYQGTRLSPEIIIGDNCNIGAGNHITAVTGIYIGDNVLTGKFILITDNAHGSSTKSDLELPPRLRPLRSKGPVRIEDDVWIGDKASIMPGVTIGRGSVVAANSVVTHDVPPYCIVGGVPAKILRKL